MSLLKQLPTRFGIDSEYNKVFGAYLDNIENKLCFSVLSYGNKAAKDGGFDPMEKRSHSFPSFVEDGENVIGYRITTADDLTKKAYEYLKTLETFANATDI